MCLYSALWLLKKRKCKVCFTQQTAAGKIGSYRALVVCGNRMGAAGFGVGRGDEVKDALTNALRKAEKDLVPVDFSPDGSLYHDVVGQHNNIKVLLRARKFWSM